MKHQQGRFRGAGGIELFYQSWSPDEAPTATVALVHGLGEHSGRYQNVVDCFVPRGWAVYGFDHRGHGRSPGRRGHIDSFADFREDVAAFLKLVNSEEPAVPLVLFGHSLGGLVVLNYALHHPQGLDAVIASSPHLSDPPVAGWKTFLAGLLSAVWPSFTLGTGLDQTALSRDRQVVAAYRADALVHDRGTARLSTEVADAVQWTQENAARFEPPLLLIHGDADQVCVPEGSAAFYESCGCARKLRLLYTGGYHEPHNDIHRERVLIDMAHWVEQQLEIAAREKENTE